MPTAYDDGGFSGGNVERPALQRLIADIQAGQVKVIVVYKVDRLTRSLADFAKLVELFDAQGVSFVSVTQQFNTTTSMGRLTLNVLLSFAQFEREVTGERIRDKIAASKRKGLWMGGVPPAGYAAAGRSLIPQEPHASRIRAMYELYLHHNCVRTLSEDIQARGWRTPERQNKRPGFGGNKPYGRGHLYRILGNPIYAGMVPHKGELHPGQHPAIVDEALWKQVQQRLEHNRQGHKTQARAAQPSLLSGKLVDESGRRLIPSHAQKGNTRYRYYVTAATEAETQTGDPIRLPAKELEQLVVQAVVNWLADDKRVLDAVGWGDAPWAVQALQRAKQLAQQLQSEPRVALLACLGQVEVAPQVIRVTLDLLACGLQQATAAAGEGKHHTHTIEVPAQRKRCGMAVRLVIGSQGQGTIPTRQPDPTLVALMAKGKQWLRQFTWGGQAIEVIAQREKVSVRYVNRVINVALLAPDIVQAIERGEHAQGLNATKLITSVPFPEDWAQQRQLLGMG